MYKDKDKQREADRARQQRRRDKVKAKGVTEEGVMQGVTKIQDTPEFAIPDYGQADCQCKHCKQNRTNGGKHTINHGPYKTASQLADNEVNRVSLPGDPDYVGVCHQTHQLEPQQSIGTG